MKLKRYAVVIHTANNSIRLPKLFLTHNGAVRSASRKVSKMKDTEALCIDVHEVTDQSTPLTGETLAGFIV